MRIIATVAALLSIVPSFAYTNREVETIQYEGRESCDDEERVDHLKYVKVHYTGTISEYSKTGERGKEFDCSLDRFTTLDFQVGTGQGLPGMDHGLIGLCKDAKATITVPPQYGYGAKGSEDFDIPPGATLQYEVFIEDVKSEIEEHGNLFISMDYDGSGDLTKEEVLEYMEKQIGRKTLPEGFWEGQDKDGDGFISWDEFTGPKGTEKPITAINMFERIDVDSDGYISREELETFAMRVHGLKLKSEVWNREDRNGDGRISWEEFTGQKGRTYPTTRKNKEIA